MPSSSQPPHSEPPSLFPTSFSTLTASLTTTPDTPRVSMPDTLDQPLLTVLKSTTPQPTPAQPSPPNSTPYVPSTSALPTRATPTPPINLSLRERLIYNNTPVHAALWIPDVNRHHALHQPMATPWLTGHQPKPAPASLLRHPATYQHCATNLHNDRHGFIQPRATLQLPEPDPPDHSNQPCHALYRTMASTAFTTLSPWPITYQKCHQHPPQPLSAANHKTVTQILQQPASDQEEGHSGGKHTSTIASQPHTSVPSSTPAASATSSAPRKQMTCDPRNRLQLYQRVGLLDYYGSLE